MSTAAPNSAPDRKTFEVIVAVRWKKRKKGQTGDMPATHWLTPDMKQSTRKAKALRLQFYLWPNMAEQSSIEFRVDALSGGIGETVDLQRGLDNALTVARRDVEMSVWPPTEAADGAPGSEGGRPEAATETEEEELDKLFQAGWRQYDGTTARALNRMTMIANRLEVGAAWRVLLVLPEDEDAAAALTPWLDLATKEMPLPRRENIVAAYLRAKQAAEADSGK